MCCVIVSGFSQTGVYPLSYPQLQRRLKNFMSGGIKKKVGTENWLMHKKVVQNEILVLPAIPNPKKKKRKTVDVSGRLLTKDVLHTE
jgi:hypothetical protein